MDKDTCGFYGEKIPLDQRVKATNFPFQNSMEVDRILGAVTEIRHLNPDTVLNFDDDDNDEVWTWPKKHFRQGPSPVQRSLHSMDLGVPVSASRRETEISDVSSDDGKFKRDRQNFIFANPFPNQSI